MGLLGPEGRRRMELKNLPNDKVFTRYGGDLKIRIRNEKNLNNVLQLLNRFKDFLGEYPPSAELAKGFLAQYANNVRPHTWYNYVGEIKRFMAWYGEPTNLKAKLPKTLPSYYEDKDIEALLTAAKSKKTHKKSIPRDVLLIELAWRTGLRRAELSNLSAGDIHVTDKQMSFLVVRRGKEQKDRVVPLALALAEKLQNFTKGMSPNERLFKLNTTSLGMKIKELALRAGMKKFHCHDLRHKFATDVLETGANIEVLRKLMGHSSIATTQVYLSATDKSLHDAIELLEKPEIAPTFEEGLVNIHPIAEYYDPKSKRVIKLMPPTG
jgi:integrase